MQVSVQSVDLHDDCTCLTRYIIMTDYKDKIKALAERNRLATTDEERAAVSAEMNALRSENEQAFTEALEGLIKTTAKDIEMVTV